MKPDQNRQKKPNLSTVTANFRKMVPDPPPQPIHLRKALFKGFPNIPHIPLPPEHSVGKNEATRSPTRENPESWKDQRRPREILCCLMSRELSLPCDPEGIGSPCTCTFIPIRMDAVHPHRFSTALFDSIARMLHLCSLDTGGRGGAKCSGSLTEVRQSGPEAQQVERGCDKASCGYLLSERQPADGGGILQGIPEHARGRGREAMAREKPRAFPAVHLHHERGWRTHIGVAVRR